MGVKFRGCKEIRHGLGLPGLPHDAVAAGRAFALALTCVTFCTSAIETAKANPARTFKTGLSTWWPTDRGRDRAAVPARQAFLACLQCVPVARNDAG
jgi:hypothetical protein